MAKCSLLGAAPPRLISLVHLRRQTKAKLSSIPRRKLIFLLTNNVIREDDSPLGWDICFFKMEIQLDHKWFSFSSFVRFRPTLARIDFSPRRAPHFSPTSHPHRRSEREKGLTRDESRVGRWRACDERDRGERVENILKTGRCARRENRKSHGTFPHIQRRLICGKGCLSIHIFVDVCVVVLRFMYKRSARDFWGEIQEFRGRRIIEVSLLSILSAVRSPSQSSKNFHRKTISRTGKFIERSGVRSVNKWNRMPQTSNTHLSVAKRRRERRSYPVSRSLDQTADSLSNFIYIQVKRDREVEEKGNLIKSSTICMNAAWTHTQKPPSRESSATSKNSERQQRKLDKAV